MSDMPSASTTSRFFVKYLWQGSCALIALALTAPRARAQRSAASVIDIVAHEYAFTMPDTIPAGLTMLRLHDAGAEWHHVKLARLDANHTAAEAYAALRTGGGFPAWLAFVGGPNSPAPGGTSELELQLETGTYVLWCNVTAPDGQTHWAHGMFKGLVVAPSTRHAQLPAGDLTITLRDYAFDLSQPITRGAHAIRVTNGAQQAHEIFILKLGPHDSTRAVEDWLTHRSPSPPGTPLGGTTDIPPGGTLLMPILFPGGRYAFICWVDDAHDGRPHWQHGMIKVIDVR
jgi:hypothetical protein